MKFLIVNGYHASRNNFKLIEQFKQLIWDITQSLKEVADVEFEFVIVDRHSVQEYLFEPETSLVRPEHGLKFDALDMIFIAASPNVRPWHHRMRSIITLIRMCLKTKKLLFMTSFGAQALAYLCATNIQNYINITNGYGEGCKLVDFPKFTNQALKNGSDDFFLDSTTGDLYFYSKQTDEWMPKSNVGIHHRRDAMEYQSIGKFVVKSPTYKPKQQMLSNQTEMTCIIKKQFLNFWLFKDVQMEFSIKQSNAWDIHTITFVNPEKRFSVLAENNFRGPLILQCDNILALLFEIENKSRDQINIISNFIENGIKTIRYSSHYNQISITFEKYFNTQKGIKNIEIIFDKTVKKTNKLDDSIKPKSIEYRKLINAQIQEQEREKLHAIQAGLSNKINKQPETVSHNNIMQKNYKVKRRKSFSLKQQQLMMLSQQVQNHEFLQQNPNLNNLFNDQQQIKSSRHIKMNTEPKPQPRIKQDDDFDNDQKAQKNQFNQIQVRKILHPSLDEQFLGQKRIWIPGFLNYKLIDVQSGLTSTRKGSRPLTDRF
ncbi:unnamed protein product [Paramecium primaurelia]|uniref:Uncharacterized protein n=1 Tax=Paramecium primaurelia TaxID=5886 RepID=A0A8S1K7X1_PARPR|nr:unnamed protein product [Paramecium primaurelia]